MSLCVWSRESDKWQQFKNQKLKELRLLEKEKWKDQGRSMKLYNQQERVVREIVRNFRKEKTQCLAWYTGSGKTNIYIAICEQMLKKNPKAMIGVSAYLTTEIRDQIYQRFCQFGMADRTFVIDSPVKQEKGSNIIVFNPQGMVTDIPNVTFDLLIIDEAHVGTDEHCVMLKKIMAKTCNKKTRLLLGSATPWDTLALKEFRDAKIYKRSLDQGLKDGLITDFNFVAEEAMIDFMDEEFNRRGDLKAEVIQKKMKVLKSTCIGKMNHIIKKYDKQLGDKVVVICPPGNASEIASSMAKEFGGLAFLQRKSGLHKRDRGIDTREIEDTAGNLAKFQEDADVRFLFVVNKCQTGFDYKEMTSVVDMTMTRNVKLLMQRTGRIARKNGNVEKNYFYVYDRALGPERLEWLIMTMVDLSMGNFDDIQTKTLKYRAQQSPETFVFKDSAKISEIIKALSDSKNYTKRREIKFVQGASPRKFTAATAKMAMSKFKSRTEMWADDPGLYKWLRVNAKEIMDEFFPMKNHLGRWNEFTINKVLKEHRGMQRSAFKDKFGGAEYWINKNKRQDLYDKYLAKPTYDNWTAERAAKALKGLKKWTHVRQVGGLRSWMQRHGTEAKWRARWESGEFSKKAAL